MRTACWIIAGIIGLPFFVVAFLALLLVFLALNLAFSIPCIAIWAIFVCPFVFIWACANFALDDKLDGFCFLKSSFIAMADPMHGFRDVLIPIGVDAKDTVVDSYRDWKEFRSILKEAKKSKKENGDASVASGSDTASA